jgi:hypothetical protein
MGGLFTPQDANHIVQLFPIGFLRQVAKAGTAAVSHHVFQTMDMILFRGGMGGAGSETEMGCKKIHGVPEGIGLGKGAEIEAVVIAAKAHQRQPRERLRQINADVEEAFVVP